MAYITGVANNATDLLNAILNAATGNGWTGVAAGIVSKDGGFFHLTVNGNTVAVQAGLGESGGALVSPSPSAPQLDTPNPQVGSPPPVSYPLTYHIHVNENPSDIVIFTNYDTVYWQWMCFGKARNLGVDGTCTYQTASGLPGTTSSALGYMFSIPPGNSVNGRTRPFAPFYPMSTASSAATHCAINLFGSTWNRHTGSSNPTLTSNITTQLGTITSSMLQPNAWNGQIVLKRMLIHHRRVSNFISYVAELSHIRLCRNDNYADGDEVTIGDEVWKIYPLARKNSAARDGSTSGNGAISHSGTMAIAVRKVV